MRKRKTFLTFFKKCEFFFPKFDPFIFWYIMEVVTKLLREGIKEGEKEAKENSVGNLSHL